MPAGITCDLGISRGNPKTYVTAWFNQSTTASPGVYPIIFTAVSATYSTTKTVNLTVHDYNGWTLDGKYFRNASLSYENGSNYAKIEMISRYYDGGTAQAIMRSSVPSTDGTYSYRLVTKASAANEMELSLNDQSNAQTFYNVDSTDHQMATIKITGGKVSLAVPPTRVYPNVGDTTLGKKTISINATE